MNQEVLDEIDRMDIDVDLFKKWFADIHPGFELEDADIYHVDEFESAYCGDISMRDYISEMLYWNPGMRRKDLEDEMRFNYISIDGHLFRHQ